MCLICRGRWDLTAGTAAYIGAFKEAEADMVTSMRVLLLLMMVAPWTLACAQLTAAPSDEPAADLRLRLELSQDVVDSPRDAFVTVIAENAGFNTLVVATGYLSFTVEGEGAIALPLPVPARSPGPFEALVPGGRLQRQFSHDGLNDGQVQWRLEPGMYQVRAVLRALSEGDQRWIGRIKEEDPMQIPDRRLWMQRVESPPAGLTVRHE